MGKNMKAVVLLYAFSLYETEIRAICSCLKLPIFEPYRPDGTYMVRRPVVDRVLPLSDAAAAHAHMETNANVGKIVLIV